MATEARIRELDSRHHQLDNRIDDVMKSPSSDRLQIAALKKEKLRLKEEIERLRKQQ